jgi:hypothetical protein
MFSGFSWSEKRRAGHVYEALTSLRRRQRANTALPSTRRIRHRAAEPAESTSTITSTGIQNVGASPNFVA